jgi:hypothetical protein
MLERKSCREIGGGQRRPSVDGQGGWARGSDDDGSTWCAIETKRTTRYSLRRKWIEQAREHTRRDGRPWVLVIAEHNDRRRIVVVEYATMVELVRKAGLVDEVSA